MMTYKDLIAGRIPAATGWAWLWDRSIPRGKEAAARRERHASVTPMHRRHQRPARADYEPPEGQS